jgi:hypothetical protein
METGEARSMHRIALAVALVAVSGMPVAAQTTASLGSGALPEIQPVVQQCQIIADNPAQSDPVEGVCIGATTQFLSALPPGPPAAVDARITDLVVALVPLVEQHACGKFDWEIAAAIKLASSYVSTDEQKNALLEISTTVGDCSLGKTAAVPQVAASQS